MADAPKPAPATPEHYRVESASALADLVTLVNIRAAQGWRPQGGVTMQGTLFLQALVKT